MQVYDVFATTRQVDSWAMAAIPETPSVAPSSGAWGLLRVFADGEVDTGETQRRIQKG